MHLFHSFKTILFIYLFYIELNLSSGPTVHEDFKKLLEVR
ncbi:MAG: hypothetical protein ACI90V_002604 [Bacillariaceae sp.]|jgi:hypothetical protein